jgi:hypothetical protein
MAKKAAAKKTAGRKKAAKVMIGQGDKGDR